MLLESTCSGITTRFEGPLSPPVLPFASPPSLMRSRSRIARSLPQLLELLEKHKHEHGVGSAM
jgi:hypothetical protein